MRNTASAMNMPQRLRTRYSSALGLALLLTSCGGTSDTANTFTISGTVSGLTTSGLVLTNGMDTTVIAPGATSFAFPTKMALGEVYSVVARVQPTERDQMCMVSAGSGIVSADVSTVTISCRATQWVVSTIAGSGAPGASDGVRTAASFSSPWGIAVDSGDNLYVADRGNNKVRRVTSAGVVTTLAGSGTLGFADGPGTTAMFNVPQGVAVDAAGTVYVADSTNGTIRKVTEAGFVSSLAGSPSTIGRIGSIDGTGINASFNNPTALVVAADGNTYVADTYNRIIRQITSSGVVTTLAGTAAVFPQPVGIAADSASNLYFIDGNSARIFKIAANATVTVLAGSGAVGTDDGMGSTASFTSPYGIAVDVSGNVYVGESIGIIRKISPSGRVTTIAGTPYAAGTVDGVGSAASFQFPTGLTVDRAGSVYMSDYLYIRKIEAR